MPRPQIDVTGSTFGRLFVLRQYDPPGSPAMRYLVRCVCGTEKPVLGASLRSGNTSSCGCLKRDRCRESGLMSAKHGGTRGGRCKEYSAWASAKERCSRPGNVKFPLYGGRGIRMCQRWLDDYANFIADMGPCPPGHSLDRINSDGDYEPGNCRWTDIFTQNRNRTFGRKRACNQ